MVGNGATVHALVRGAAIAARGHAVRLVTLGEVLPAPPGLEVRTQPLPRGLAGALRAAGRFLREVRDFRPDLLHVHYAGGRLGTMATLSGVRPMVVTVMGGDVQPEQHLGGYPRLERRATLRLLRQADLLLSKSEALRAEIARYGDFADRTEVVRWGIDVRRFERDPRAGLELRERLGLPGGARVVLSPRLLRPLYNVHLLVEALPAVRARVPGVLLLLAGHRADEAYRARLERRVDELGLGAQVRFLGRIEYADMPALYSASDAVVSIPFSDGLPQTLFEALASRTPAVIGRLQAYAEVVQDGREALFTELEPAAVADALVRVLTDPELARRLAEAGLARVREVASLERDAERVEGLYRRLLARPRPRPDPLPLRLLDAATLLFR